MKQYIETLQEILNEGFLKSDRTGTGTLSQFAKVMRFDLTGNKLPLLTTKKMFHRSFIHELLWFISGSTDIKYLKDQGISIWDSWVKEGTATYRPMTEEEMLEGIEKELGEDTLDVLSTVLDNEGKKVIKQRYREITGKEPQILTGGSIGNGAYGAMWRNIQDTRIIENDQIAEYTEKGFVIVHDYGKGYVVNRRIDQLANVIKLLKTDPSNRRMVVNAFDPRMVDFCELAPCHSTWAVWTRELTLEERVCALSKEKMGKFVSHFDISFDNDSPSETLDAVTVKEWLDEEDAPKHALRILLFMRSNDFAVGNPFNIAQYALLGHMLAHVTNMVCEELVWVGSDTHVYIDQINQAHEQVTREIYENTATVELNPDVKDIDDFTFDDVVVKGYDNHHPSIKYPVAV